MALDSIKIQLNDFAADPSLKTLAYEMADRVQLKAPSDAYVWMNMQKKDRATEAQFRIVSGSGIFKAAARHTDEKACLELLEKRIMERLNSWKRRRFLPRGSNGVSDVKSRYEHKLNFWPPEVSYDYTVQGTEDRFKEESDRAARDLRSHIGHEPSIHVEIERENRSKNIYSVSMSVVGLQGRTRIKKSGKNVPQLIKKVKKMTLSRIRRQRQKNFRRKNLKINKHLFAS